MLQNQSAVSLKAPKHKNHISNDQKRQMPSRWLKESRAKKFEEHRRRVREAQSSISKAKPLSMPMGQRRESERKREQMEIEKNNRILLDRLGTAMASKNIDNEFVPQNFVSYLSMQRKRTLKKIVQDNKRLLERIQYAVPSYHKDEWERDHQQRVEYLRNMTEFPEYFNPPGSALSSNHPQRVLIKPPSSSRGDMSARSQQSSGATSFDRNQQEMIGAGVQHNRPFLPDINQPPPGRPTSNVK